MKLSTSSPVFKEMWSSNDVQMPGEATKQLHHPLVGTVTMELSSFTVDGRPDLRMIVYSPAAEVDANRIRELVKAHRKTYEARQEPLQKLSTVQHHCKFDASSL